MKRIVLAVAMLSLAGCETAAPRPDQVKAGHAVAYQSASDGDATIIVTRDVGFSGSGCTAVIFMDGKEAASLETGERVTLHVPSGIHIIGSWPRGGGGLCGGGGKNNRIETDASIKPGQVRKFRVGSGYGITPTTT